MERRTKVIAGAGIAALAIAAGTGIAVAGAGDDDDSREGPDVPIEGTDLDQATAAALAHTGGGRVTGTEVGDEESLYEVEVTLDDGTEVDVQLDADFQVVGEERDGGPDDD